MTKIKIKNMVCPRCIMVVTQCIRSLGLHPTLVELGSAETQEQLTPQALTALADSLHQCGFEVIDHTPQATVEQIKQCLIAAVSQRPADHRPLSAIVAQACDDDYATLSRTFSTTEGRTIESYFIALRTERIKELLSYKRQSIKEIAYDMGFSSVAHLSRQFKQVTGQTPTQFQQTGLPSRRPLCEV